MEKLQPQTILCTLDVNILYTSLLHIEGILAIKEILAIHRPPHELPYSEYIIELLQRLLENIYFNFNGKHYHQVSDTTMGTKLVPSYANLFIAIFEMLHVPIYPLQVVLWYRFIDATFII